MSAISQKSISGITSITTPAGVDNVFTVHTNDTTERFRVDSTGSLNIAGISTFNGVIDAIGNIQIRNNAPILKFSETDNSKDFFIVGDSNKLSIRKNTTAGGNVVQEWMDNSVLFRENVDIDADIDVDGHTNLDNVSIAGVTTAQAFQATTGTFTGDVDIASTLCHSGDTDTKITFATNTIKFDTDTEERLRIDSNGLIQAKTRSAEVRRMILSGSPSNSAFNIEAHDGETGTSSGDVQGKLGLFYNDGSTLTNTANISFERGSGAANGAMAFVTNQTERLRITSDGKVGINTSSLNHLFEVHALGNDANNFQQITFEKKASANNKQAFGLVIRSNAQTSSGNEPTAYLKFDARPSSLNGSHGGNAIIAFSPIGVTQGTYGKGNLDFYLRSGGTYTFQNDPGGVGEMQPKLRIDSSGRVMIGTTTEGFATYGDQFTIANGGHCGMTIRSGTSNYGTIYFSDGDDGSADEVRGFVDYNHSTNMLQLGTNGSARLRITSDGSVRIGEDGTFTADTGADELVIGSANSGVNRGMTILNHTGQDGRICFAQAGDPDAGMIKYSHGSDVMQFYVESSERVRIKDHGEINVYRGGNGDVFEYWRVSQSLFVVDNLSNESNTRMRIRNPNGQINYNSSSDYRLKENDVKITDGITRIKKLRPIQFKWKSGTNTYDGFFAHEVSEACPMAVDGTKDQVATADDVSKGYAKNVGDPIYQGIDHGKMVPVLTAALQEAITKIETLEAKVAALEGS